MQSQVLSWTYRAQLALFKGEMQQALEAAESALQLAEEESDPAQAAYTARGSVWAHWLIGAALLVLDRLVEAELHLGEALFRCRRINLVELEPDILLSWARWHYAAGNREDALGYAEEALSIADRSEYRLKQAEIQNFMGQWSLDGGKVARAKQCAEKARSLALCDGLPHAYIPAIHEAEGLLELLDQPANDND